MTSTSILTRTTDGKKFRVAVLSHWSDIVSEDGETDSVKWYGGNKRALFVSASKGFSYEVDEAGA